MQAPVQGRNLEERDVFAIQNDILSQVVLMTDTHAYVFIGPTAWGFTHDPAAKNLPPEEGPWSFFRNALIPPPGEGSGEEREVLAELSRQGFSVRPFRHIRHQE
jgi:hypothetical protein